MSLYASDYGFSYVTEAVPREHYEGALRKVWQELRRHGALAEEIAEWSDVGWFPWLRTEPEIWNVLPSLFDGKWAEPQIVVRLPDLDPPEGPDPERPLLPHVDQPVGAYNLIIGCYLTHHKLAIWVDSHKGTVPDHPTILSAEPGSVIIMDGKLAHAATLNLGPLPTAAIYFRRLSSES